MRMNVKRSRIFFLMLAVMLIAALFPVAAMAAHNNDGKPTDVNDRVFLAIYKGEGFPGEPAIYGTSSYTNINSSFRTSGYSTFASSANGLISADVIEALEEGKSSGGTVWGTTAGKNGSSDVRDWFDEDCSFTKSENEKKIIQAVKGSSVDPDDYEIIWYVIKYQTTSWGDDWHVDGVIKEKAKYSVNYSGNGSTGGEAPLGVKDIAKGGSYTVLGNTGNLSKTVNGNVHLFLGWSEDPNATVAQYVAGDVITNIDRNITLYAVWTSNVTYPGNVNVKLDDIAADFEDIYPGGTLVLRADDDASKEYELYRTAEGVYSAQLKNGTYHAYGRIGGSDVKYADDQLIIRNHSRDITLNFYSVKYETNGGTFAEGEDPATANYYANASVSTTDKIPVRDGYLFAGWKYNNTDTIYASGETFTSAIVEPAVLTAQWEKAVNVSIYLEIEHRAGDGFDTTSDKEYVPNVQLVSRPSGSEQPFLETGYVLDFAPDMSGYEYWHKCDSNNNGNFTDDDWVKETHQSETKFYHSAYSPLNGVTFTGMPEADYYVTAVKHDYQTTITTEKDEDGNWKIIVELSYQPDSFDLMFSVSTDASIPQELRPTAVIAKVAHNNSNNDLSDWKVITQQAGEDKPGVRIDLDANGNGSGFYPVWPMDGNNNPYGYRMVITSFVYPDGSIVHVNPEGGVHDHVSTVYTDDNYVATIDESKLKQGGVLFDEHYGTVYDETTGKQSADLHAQIIMESYGVTFYGMGGKVNGQDELTLQNQYYIPEFSNYQPVRDSWKFEGWYLDETYTQSAVEKTLLVSDVDLYAKWTPIQTITGTLTLNATYMLNGVEVPLAEREKPLKAVVALQINEPNETDTVQSQEVTITWGGDGKIGTSSEYRFENLDGSKEYQIYVILLNVDAYFQNSQTPIVDGVVQYNKEDRVAKFTEESPTETFVNVYLKFKDELFTNEIIVDTRLIGEGFRPTGAFVQLQYNLQGEGTDKYEVYLPHQNGGVQIDIGGDGLGRETVEIWKELYDGTLYDYTGKLIHALRNGAQESYSEALPYTYSSNNSRFSPHDQAPTDPIVVWLEPKVYVVTLDVNADGDEVTGMEGYSGAAAQDGRYMRPHTWSFDTPIYAEPQREGYVFGGWKLQGGDDAAIFSNNTVQAAVAQDITLEAQWLCTVIWVDEDGTVLETDENVPVGSMPSFDGEEPSKAPTAQYTYSFKGWTPEVSTVTGNTTYTATYEATVNKYQVFWKNDNGELLKQETYDYGATPTYTGETPEKEPNAQYTYAWTGAWDKEIVPVTGETTYTATYTQTANVYTVTWKNEDGTPLEKDENIPYGTMPEYNAAEPAKAEDAQYTYGFAGWTPELSEVTGDITYTARFTPTLRSYTVTWVNYDGTELKKDTVAYGETPAYTGETPAKPSDDQYSYTHNGWTPEIATVTGDATYTATYASTTRTYTVTWVDEDGTVLEKDENVTYGTMPKYDGAVPTKPADAQYTYTFNKWSPNVVTVTGDVTYTVTYTGTTNAYTVTWVDEDGTVLEKDKNVLYGTTPSYDGTAPQKASDVQYTYSFKGWTPEVSTVTGNATYKAVYDKTTNAYTVTWKNYDGEELKKDTVAYGETPSYSGTPVKPADAQYTYAHSGWTPNVVPVTGDAEYTAVFTPTNIPYTVTWKNHDGSVLSTETYNYGDEPTYKGATPTKSSNAGNSYTFSGWTPHIVAVTSDAAYTAVFAPAASNTYTVTWLNYNDEVLETDNAVPVNTAPSYDGATPVKPADAQYSYVFAGWEPAVVPVTANATYKAVFDPVLNSYTVTWMDENGTQLEFDPAVPYGSTPSYDGTAPVKAADARYTYSFAGWTPAVSAVTGHAVYTATYTKVERSFTVTWKNENGSVLETDSGVPYGTVPVYNAADPVSPNGEGYVFNGWTPAIEPVTADVVYTATFRTEADTPTPESYTVLWLNEDGTLLEKDSSLAAGATPEYNGAAPTKAADARYTYSFAGWTPEVVPVTGHAVYTAAYTPTERTYTVTWLHENGDVLETDTNVSYGATPSYDGTMPVKTGEAGNSYSFTGWTPALSAVTADVTYTAAFTPAQSNRYTVTWMNGETVLKTDTHSYGDMPNYTGATPTKASSTQYDYHFSGWSPTVTTVTSSAAYYAQFTETVRTYTVTWKNEDGTVLETDNAVPYGAMPAYNSPPPTKAGDAQYSYSFAGWDNPLGQVTCDVTYTAKFNSSVKTYTVIWQDENGKELEKDENVPYGTTPTYDGTQPKKAATAQYSYSFDGWTPAVTAVTGDAVYKATYKPVLNTYMVRWLNEDGSELEKDVNVAYGATPSYNGDTPAKASTAQYSYTFAGWTPEVVTVTGNTTYKATYTPVERKYTVTWLNDSGSELEKDENVAYGATPSYDGITPVKASDAQYSYTFKGWTPTVAAVSGDAVYTAVYEKSTRTYTVTWLNADGTQLEKDVNVLCGAMPTYDGSTPVYTGTVTEKPADGYLYTFKGWTPTVAAVSGDAVYVATYTASLKPVTPTTNKPPVVQTADETGVMLWMALALASSAGLAALQLAERRSRKK